MNLAEQKIELIKWINSIENSKIIKEVEAIKIKETFDFEKEWERSLSGNELRERTKPFKIIALEKINVQYLPEIETRLFTSAPKTLHSYWH